MAECHPGAFQWVTEAKARGAKVVHIDPRFTRTSAIADLHVPLRAGSDIVFLGALVNHVLQNDLYFRDYVVAYTNAASIIREEFRDTEDLDGLFSGWDPDAKQYDQASWQYETEDGPRGDGVAEDDPSGAAEQERLSQHETVKDTLQADAAGSGGPPLRGKPKRDETLQHPRTVFQILKRHFARYTPEKVAEACGIEPEAFLKVAEWVTANSGRDRTTAFVYSVGWTQHTVGAQYIRTASILQALLGNMGRPGGGILALRGHASRSEERRVGKECR